MTDANGQLPFPAVNQPPLSRYVSLRRDRAWWDVVEITRGEEGTAVRSLGWTNKSRRRAAKHGREEAEKLGLQFRDDEPPTLRGEKTARWFLGDYIASGLPIHVSDHAGTPCFQVDRREADTQAKKEMCIRVMLFGIAYPVANRAAVQIAEEMGVCVPLIDWTNDPSEPEPMDSPEWKAAQDAVWGTPRRDEII